MDVARYTFQSPYSSQVQVGRPDPSSKQDTQSQGASSELVNDMGASAKNTQPAQPTSNVETESAVVSEQLLDIYV